MVLKEDTIHPEGGYASVGSSIKGIAVDTIFHTIEVAVRKLFHKTENSIRRGVSTLHEAASYFGERVWYYARDVAYHYVVNHPEVFVTIPSALGIIDWARRNNPGQGMLPILVLAGKARKPLISPFKAPKNELLKHKAQTLFNQELATRQKIAQKEKPFSERIKPIISKAPYVLAASGLGALAMKYFRNRPRNNPQPPPPPPAPPIVYKYQKPYYIQKLEKDVENINNFFSGMKK